MKSHCGIILGTDLEAFVLATILARKGLPMLMLEAGPTTGGLTRSLEFSPGYHTGGILDRTSGIRPSVWKALGRSAIGPGRRDGTSATLSIHHDEPSLCLAGLYPTLDSQLRHHSEHDHDRWETWTQLLASMSAGAAALVEGPGIDLAHPFRNQLKRAGAIIRMKHDARKELLRALTMSLEDWLGDHFKNDRLQAALALPALLGTPLGPRAAGTSAALLLHQSLRSNGLVGGEQALVQQLEQQSRELGFRVQTRAQVARIHVVNQAVRGVELADGSLIEAPIVVSTLDPCRTILGLLSPRVRPPELADLQYWRHDGHCAVLHFALRGAPAPRRQPGRTFREMLIVDSLREIELAARAVKYGELADDLPLMLRVPTLENPDLAPPGHHVLTVLASPIPHEPRSGSSDERQRDLRDRVVRRLNARLPNFSDMIVDEQVLLPDDLERTFGLTGGHLFGGATHLDQSFFLRPHHLLSRTSTPINGLYMVGPGIHPGPWFPGASSLVAAWAILKRR